VTPNPGFKVTGYLKVEYLADGASFQLYEALLQITWSSTENVPKIGDRRTIFLAGRCFTSVMEIKPNRVSLR